MRCSICDKQDTKFVYNNWHCYSCEDAIRKTSGDFIERDMFDLFENDEDIIYEDTSDMS